MMTRDEADQIIKSYAMRKNSIEWNDIWEDIPCTWIIPF